MITLPEGMQASDESYSSKIVSPCIVSRQRHHFTALDPTILNPSIPSNVRIEAKQGRALIT
jgi:hypothetical protein